jgi:hypothetical protein
LAGARQFLDHSLDSMLVLAHQTQTRSYGSLQPAS